MSKTVKKLDLRDRILVRILADRDAIFSPTRLFDPGNHGHVNRFLFRRDYFAAGIPWASEGTDATERKAAQVALERLADSGLVEIIKVDGVTRGVKLMDAGEIRAESLSIMPSLLHDYIWSVFDAVCRRCGEWTWEDHLIAAWRKAFEPIGEWDRTACLSHISDCIVPFVARDWLLSASTTGGNVRYKSGPHVEKASRPDVEWPDVDDATAEIGRAYYVSCFNAAWDRLSTDTPSNRQEIGFIPLAQSAVCKEELEAWRRSAELASQCL